MTKEIAIPDTTAIIEAQTQEDKKKLTPKQEKLLFAFIEEGSPTRFNKKQSLLAAGYAESTVWAHVFPGIREEFIERTKDILAVEGPKIATDLLDIIENPTQAGVREKLKAITTAMDRIGIVKEEKVDHHVTHSAVFVLPEKVEHEVIDVDFEEVSDGADEGTSSSR